jgi:prevent-host-death family protein
MLTVNIHEAKTHLSRLIEAAVRGEPFIIAKAGKPMVQVTALKPADGRRRLEFMKGEFRTKSSRCLKASEISS